MCELKLPISSSNSYNNFKKYIRTWRIQGKEQGKFVHTCILQCRKRARRYIPQTFNHFFFVPRAIFTRLRLVACIEGSAKALHHTLRIQTTYFIPLLLVFTDTFEERASLMHSRSISKFMFACFMGCFPILYYCQNVAAKKNWVPCRDFF